MILISSTQIDATTNTVMEWIRHYSPSKRIIRINDDLGYTIEFKGKDVFLVVKEERINLEAIQSFWYRRGRIRYKRKKSGVLNDLQEKEEQLLEEYLHFLLSKKRCINQQFNSEPNKLIVLEVAKSCGILIPESYLVESKVEFEKLAKTDLITKNFLGGSMFEFSDTSAVLYTQTVDQSWDVPNYFSPSLLQKNIAKKYELRVFYLNGELSCMAIFSQGDEQTKDDFRMYNQEKPNRTVPFILPKELTIKLTNLMNELQLNSGSIDMIVTPENEFIFLEVNPIGQLGMVSFPCNYNLEQQIAHYLCH